MFSHLGIDRFSKNLLESFWTSFLTVFEGSGGAFGEPLGRLWRSLGAPGVTLSRLRGHFGVSGEIFGASTVPHMTFLWSVHAFHMEMMPLSAPKHAFHIEIYARFHEWATQV